MGREILDSDRTQHIRNLGASQVERIMAEVAEQRELSLTQIKARSRARPLVLARQEIMYRASSETPASLPTIARLLGLGSHTTVLQGKRAHARRLARAAGVSQETTETVHNAERQEGD